MPGKTKKHRAFIGAPVFLLPLLLAAPWAPAAFAGAGNARNAQPRAGTPSQKNSWSLAGAAKRYKGVTITASFLPQPSDKAAIQLNPEFGKATGIEVKRQTVHYQKLRNVLVPGLTTEQREGDAISICVVWIGGFASDGQAVPLANPSPSLNGFCSLLPDASRARANTTLGGHSGCDPGLPFCGKCQRRKQAQIAVGSICA